MDHVWMPTATQIVTAPIQAGKQFLVMSPDFIWSATLGGDLIFLQSFIEYPS
jgi:hypothetical protein